jgi:hypothetical protein
MKFVRFVFAILLAGMLVNLGIVLLANSASHHRQVRQTEDEKRRLADMLGQVDGHVRRLDLAVESQHVRADDSVTESTVLVRQYRSVGTDQSQPLPVKRLVIPGDRIQVTGLMLEFASAAPAEEQEYSFFRNRTLLYFSLVCGADQHAPDQSQPDERFTFTPSGVPPQLSRLDPLAVRPTYFESRAWEHLWQHIRMPQPGTSLPWSFDVTSAGGDDGAMKWLKVTWTKPAARTLRRSHTYTAFISAGGEVTLDEDKLPCIPNLLNIMLEEAQKQNDERTGQ